MVAMSDFAVSSQSADIKIEVRDTTNTNDVELGIVTLKRKN